MQAKAPFSLRQRIRSFGYAIRGLRQFCRKEHNLWIHLGIALIAFVLGLVLKISASQWIAVIVVTAMVLSAEAFNTCIETAMDHLRPELHPTVRYIKDLAAGAVLITAIAAALTGLIIFVPKVLALF